MSKKFYEAIVRVIQVGNATGITIPTYILEALGIERGEHIKVTVERVTKKEVDVFKQQKPKKGK